MNKISRKLLCAVMALCLTAVCLMGITVPARAESVDTVPYTNYTYWETYGSKTPVATKAVFQAFDVT